MEEGEVELLETSCCGGGGQCAVIRRGVVDAC
jgi:hypothetical protein